MKFQFITYSHVEVTPHKDSSIQTLLTIINSLRLYKVPIENGLEPGDYVLYCATIVAYFKPRFYLMDGANSSPFTTFSCIRIMSVHLNVRNATPDAGKTSSLV